MALSGLHPSEGTRYMDPQGAFLRKTPSGRIDCLRRGPIDGDNLDGGRLQQCFFGGVGRRLGGFAAGALRAQKKTKMAKKWQKNSKNRKKSQKNDFFGFFFLKNTSETAIFFF